MRSEFTAVYEDGDDGWVVAYVEELPGVNTQGKTIEEARENLEDALKLMLETYREETRASERPEARREPIAVTI